jgi:hypothetical protein
VNLLKVLLISWLVGAGLSYIKAIDMGYTEICLMMSLIYLFSAVFCYHYIEIELKLKNKTNACLISFLCMCMVITSWFNYIFVNPDIYHLLIDARRGDGLSWKNIYKTIELICLLTVGRNGIINLRSWLVCRWHRFNVIITNNSTYNIGR